MRMRRDLILLFFMVCLVVLAMGSGCSSMPPLHSAAMKNDLAKADRIVEKGKTDINSITMDGKTALHYAARYGHLEMAGLLREAGAELDKQCACSWTPLIEASYYGHYDVAEWLVNQGCDVTLKTNNGASALYMACNYKYDKIAGLLIPCSQAVLNDPDNNGLTPLHAACDDTYESIPLVIQHPDAKPSPGEYLESQQMIVKMLLAAGADVSIQSDDYGLTALCCLIRDPNALPALEILLANGASVHCRTNAGYLPLHVAAEKGNVPAFECLVRNGVAIEPMESSDDISGRTFHLYADCLGKGDTPEQCRQYYDKAIQEYETAIEKNQAMADSLGGKIFNLKARKFAMDVAMILAAAAASSYSPSYDYYYIPGQLDLSSLQLRKRECEAVVSRCEQWLAECKSKML